MIRSYSCPFFGIPTVPSSTRTGHDEGMASVENALRIAAFGEPEVVDERCSLRFLASAAGSGPRCRWLAAVVLGACGRYAAATTLLEPLIRDRDVVVASLAASTLASHRRQLGGHALALSLDGLAVRKAVEALSGHWDGDGDPDGLDVYGALVDGLVGLAADNLGLGRLATAEVLLARAARVAAVGGCWRAEARLGWVRAELALASGGVADSVSPAKRAREVARERGSVRHVVKSELILGAALGAMGEQENGKQATKLVTNALTTARRYGWRSLIWPAQLLLFDLDVSLADWKGSKVTNELKELLGFTDPVGSRLAQASPWVPI